MPVFAWQFSRLISRDFQLLFLHDTSEQVAAREGQTHRLLQPRGEHVRQGQGGGALAAGLEVLEAACGDVASPSQR